MYGIVLHPNRLDKYAIRVTRCGRRTEVVVGVNNRAEVLVVIATRASSIVKLCAQVDRTVLFASWALPTSLVVHMKHFNNCIQIKAVKTVRVRTALLVSRRQHSAGPLLLFGCSYSLPRTKWINLPDLSVGQATPQRRVS